jgi:hypothetical protein
LSRPRRVNSKLFALLLPTLATNKFNFADRAGSREPPASAAFSRPDWPRLRLGPFNYLWGAPSQRGHCKKICNLAPAVELLQNLFDGFWESVCRPTFDGKAVCFSGRADLLGIICRLDNLPLRGERRCVVGRRQSRWSPRPAALLCLEAALHKFPPARRGIVTNCEDHCLCRASRGLMP